MFTARIYLAINLKEILALTLHLPARQSRQSFTVFGSQQNYQITAKEYLVTTLHLCNAFTLTLHLSAEQSGQIFHEFGSQQNHQITKVFSLLKIYAFQYEGFIFLFTPLPWSRLAQRICTTKQTYL